MPLTKQQLLIPRVLCIGGKEGEPNYPDSPYKVGQIITASSKSKRFPLFGENNEENWEAWVDKKEGGAIIVSIPGLLKYRHLFKPLPWWYGRTVEEMPLYLKAKKTGVVIKPLSYTRNPEGAVNLAGEDFPTSLEWFSPADLSDYNEYQKQKQ